MRRISNPNPRCTTPVRQAAAFHSLHRSASTELPNDLAAGLLDIHGRLLCAVMTPVASLPAPAAGAV